MRKKGISFLSVAIITVISFALGFFANEIANKMFYSGGLTDEQIKLLNSAKQIIYETAIDEHDSDFIVDYALKGMAAALGDEYAYYFTAEELAEYMKSSTGTVEGGIGANVYSDNGTIVVAEVYKGLSADASGIKAGDIIIRVDDNNIDGLSLQEVVAKVKGEEGTTVKITVLRDGKELSFNVTRTNGQRELVEYYMIGNILYTKIISFHGNAVEFFEKALEYGEKNNYTGIVIDLRENPGGELDVFVAIADKLLPEGDVFYGKNRFGEKVHVESSDAQCIDKPISVIINGSSASASEALAGALRDLGDAKLIGTKSFGKGVLQSNFALDNGGMFKLTTAKYYLPNGDCIDDVGITPEFIVELPDELNEKYWLRNSDNDTQLKKAVEVLTNK